MLTLDTRLVTDDTTGRNVSTPTTDIDHLPLTEGDIVSTPSVQFATLILLILLALLGLWVAWSLLAAT